MQHKSITLIILFCAGKSYAEKTGSFDSRLENESEALAGRTLSLIIWLKSEI